MKRILGILILILGCALSGCHNGDDIGYFYGQWVVDTLTVDDELVFDGEIANEELGEVVSWRFQNNIVQVGINFRLLDSQVWVGRWKCDDITYHTTMQLYFPHYDKMPEFMMLSENMNVGVDWDAPVGDEWMILTYQGPDGQQCVMRMHKL